MITDEYISGFFDADGSITMSRDTKNCIFRTIKIDFTNTYLEILKDIQKYLFEKYNLKLFISKKPARKENHSVSYTLSSTSNIVCYKLCEIIKSHHPKKLHRINTILKYHHLVTKRNGKYTEKEKMRRLAYERLFFFNTFQH